MISSTVSSRAMPPPSGSSDRADDTPHVVGMCRLGARSHQCRRRALRLRGLYGGGAWNSKLSTTGITPAVSASSERARGRSDVLDGDGQRPPTGQVEQDEAHRMVGPSAIDGPTTGPAPRRSARRRPGRPAPRTRRSRTPRARDRASARVTADRHRFGRRDTTPGRALIAATRSSTPLPTPGASPNGPQVAPCRESAADPGLGAGHRRTDRSTAGPGPPPRSDAAGMRRSRVVDLTFHPAGTVYESRMGRRGVAERVEGRSHVPPGRQRRIAGSRVRAVGSRSHPLPGQRFLPCRAGIRADRRQGHDGVPPLQRPAVASRRPRSRIPWSRRWP